MKTCASGGELVSCGVIGLAWDFGGGVLDFISGLAPVRFAMALVPLHIFQSRKAKWMDVLGLGFLFWA